MNKSELIAATAERAGIARKDADRILNASLDIITAALVSGDKVQISGFGILEVKERDARVGRNPHTGESVAIAASRVPAFKPSKALKDAVAK